MPQLTVPEDTFRRLSARAAALNVSVDDLVKPALDRLAETGATARRANASADRRRVARRARCLEAGRARAGPDRYPPGFVLDDSRETIYREREDAQL